MRSIRHDHLLNVSDLVDRPGTSRPVRLALPVPEGLELPLVEVREPVELEGVLESVVDGVLLRGELRVRLAMECARCLTPLEETARADVVELFVDPGRVPEGAEEPEPGYAIEDARIDVDALLRDALVPAVPLRPLCREDCAGLCADCGAKLDEGDCGCATEAADPRWAALEQLDLVRGPDGTPDEDHHRHRPPRS